MVPETKKTNIILSLANAQNRAEMTSYDATFVSAETATNLQAT